MDVWVDDKRIEIFAGAAVKNGVLKYSKEAYRALLAKEKIVVDKNGSRLDLDGALVEGSRLYIKSRKR